MTDSSAGAPRSGTGLAGRELVKGHGTLNDFLVLVDPDYEVTVTAADVAAACDRRGGAGADGLIRVVRTSALPGAQRFAAEVPQAHWFMDCYRADGSVLRGCGNAARLFACVLDAEGLEPVGDGESVTIGTRGGARTVSRLAGLWTVDMGRVGLPRAHEAEAEGWDTAVVVPGLDGARAGLSVTTPEPHTVVALREEAELEAADLAGATGPGTPIGYDPEPDPASTLELVVPLGEETDPGTGQPVGRARVRVASPLTGETPSSGAACCAVAAALHQWTGEGAPQDYRILVPGGQLGVHVGPDPLAEDAHVLLTGPAAVTGRVRLA